MAIKAKSKQKWTLPDSAPLHSENLASMSLQHRLCEDARENITGNLHLTALLQLAPGSRGMQVGRAPDEAHAGAGVDVHRLKGLLQDWHKGLLRCWFLFTGSAAGFVV